MKARVASIRAIKKFRVCSIKSFLLIALVSLAQFESILANDSPEQTNHLNLTTDGYVYSTGTNGQQFNEGFSFSGWFYFKKLPSNQTFMMGYSFETMVLESKGDGTLDLWLLQQGLNIDQVPLDQWFNLAVTLDGVDAKYFLNGELLREATVTTNTIQFPDEEGDYFSLGGFWGYAKQLKLWDRALSESELNEQIMTFDSGVSGPMHQWLLNDGVGAEMINTGKNSDAAMANLTGKAFWASTNSPYEVVVHSHIKTFEINPLVHVWGAADFDQDGRKEVFVHGADDYVFPDSEPVLILEVADDGSLTDVSESMIDGGLYEKNYPSGRETIVADFNADGYDDIFYVNGSGHYDVIHPELPSLLLSQGAQGKLFPSENTIKSPPCTLTNPAFSGQKACQSGDALGQLYPDLNAPLVDMDPRGAGHGGTVGDIDRDGDLDLFVLIPGGDDDLPVTSYFLINDGNGNFTANWQLVPFKAFRYWTELFTLPDGELHVRDQNYTIARLDDYDGDGYLDMALIGQFNEAARQMVPETRFSVETERDWESIYEVIAWGNADGFSEEYTILYSENMPVPEAKDANAHFLSTDIEGDGDLDLIVGRDRHENDGTGHYLQVFRNEGERVFVDKTSELIPQLAQDILERSPGRGFQEFDFNLDGCPDFALSIPPENTGDARLVDPYQLWLNDCQGKFTAIRDSYIGMTGLMIPVDFDNDGKLDLVSLDQGLNNSGLYTSATTVKQTGNGEIRHFTDTDGDGIVDANEIEGLSGIAGLWYDPSLDGEGFNIIPSPFGAIVFFYGYTATGEQLWLVSETFQSDFGFEQIIDLQMYEGVNGTYDKPADPPEGITEWGRLSVLFGDCGTAQFELQGVDGVKTSYGVKLAGITDADCERQVLAPPSGLAGLWYDPDSDGEGLNFIVMDGNTLVFYYGYTADGERLWLVSETKSGVPNIDQPITIQMYTTSGGTFDAPAKTPEALIEWGEMIITFTGCTEATVTLNGLDGDKILNLVKLAGITESTCPE